jgi:hypothetical protein
MNRRLALFGFVLLLPAPALAQLALDQHPAEAYRLRAEYRWFSTSLEGTAAKGLLDVPGTTFDVKTDLLMEDDTTWEARGTIRLGRKWKLRGGYTTLDYIGREAVLDSRIRFDDTVFQSGEEVTSTLKGGYYGGDLEWDFLVSGTGYLGVIAGARAPDVDVVISSPALGKREQATYRPVCPVLGLAGRVYASRLSIEGFASTFAKVSGRKVTDLEISARLNLSDRLAIGGGYRYLKFTAEEGADFADFNVSGWTYGIELGL